MSHQSQRSAKFSDDYSHDEDIPEPDETMDSPPPTDDERPVDEKIEDDHNVPDEERPVPLDDEPESD